MSNACTCDEPVPGKSGRCLVCERPLPAVFPNRDDEDADDVGYRDEFDDAADWT